MLSRRAALLPSAPSFLSAFCFVKVVFQKAHKSPALLLRDKAAAGGSLRMHWCSLSLRGTQCSDFLQHSGIVTCPSLLFQKPDDPQRTGSFIPVANELKRKDKYMNVLFSCHVRKVTGTAWSAGAWAGWETPHSEVRSWEAQGEPGDTGTAAAPSAPVSKERIRDFLVDL